MTRRFPSCLVLVFAAAGFAFAPALGEDAIPLPNGDFEDASQAWSPSKEDADAGLSKVEAGAAHAGQNGLHVKQDAGGPGSWIQSPRAAIAGGKAYRISFWAQVLQQSGAGIFVSFFDADHKALPGQHFLAVGQQPAAWKEYHLDAKAPDTAAFLAVAVHAFSKQPCDADFDDFTIAQLSDADSAAAAAAAMPAPRPFGGGAEIPPVDPARVKAIAAMLDPRPKGIGPPMDDRKPWEALAADTATHDVVMGKAERFLTEPEPEISSDAWMNSALSGNRTAEPLLDRRRFRLAIMTLAEGMENKGRFVPVIEKEIAAICAEPTWVLPAHDHTLANFRGLLKEVDLGTAMTAWTLATADSMLGDRLSAPARKLIRDTVHDRAIQPFLDESAGKTHLEWWRSNPNNWNAVVHGGVTGAALALDDSVEERAAILAADEKELAFYLAGFPADGYDIEGMGYWKYGFGHYIILSEEVLNATHGKLNFYASDKARLVAQFPRRFEIVRGVYPAFADAAFLEPPAEWLYHILDCRYGLGDNTPAKLNVDPGFSTFLYAYGTNMTFDSGAPPIYDAGGAAVRGHRLRDWFDVGQVLVARMPEGQPGLNFAFKGGTNGGAHGHLDLGTYVVVSGAQPLAVDPGKTAYTGQTFSAHRFDNEVLNSYGHSVPLVAGQLQKEGDTHCASVVEKNFTEAEDSVTLDLTRGYDVPSLKSLTRRYDYLRTRGGQVTVTDTAQFDSPQAFGTAVVTYGAATEEKPGVWTITQNGQKVRVEISAAGGAPFTVKDEELKDQAAAGRVHRLGIDLNAPAASAAITVTFTPAT